MAAAPAAATCPVCELRQLCTDEYPAAPRWAIDVSQPSRLNAETKISAEILFPTTSPPFRLPALRRRPQPRLAGTLSGQLADCQGRAKGAFWYFRGVGLQCATFEGAVWRTPGHTATYMTGSLPATASARPSFTRRRRWDSASETAMFLDP